MARKKSPNNGYATEIVQLVRGNLLEGLKVIRRRTGKTNSEIFADWIEKDGLGAVFTVAARYMPKEISIDQNVHIGIETLLNNLPKAIEARHKAENELQAPDTSYTRITDQANRVVTLEPIGAVRSSDD